MASAGTAVVVGGTAGVGRAVVELLLDKGYDVGVMARGEDRLDALRDEHGNRIRAVAADAGQAHEVEAASDEIVDALGRPRIWVNSAMLTSFSPFEKMEVAEFEEIVRTTFLGTVNGVRAAIRVMAGGTVVNVGSGLAYRSVPFQSAYCASKHATNGFTSSVRSELIRDGHPLRLSLVQLPAVDTPQFEWARNRLDQMPQPAPPIFKPEVAARAVVRAAEKGPRELLVGKSVLQLVFGHMVLPDWLDRKLAEEGAEIQSSSRDEPGGRPDNLDGPVARAGTAAGRFGDRARARAAIIDGDTARKLLFLGLPLVGFLLGLALG